MVGREVEVGARGWGWEEERRRRVEEREGGERRWGWRRRG